MSGEWAKECWGGGFPNSSNECAEERAEMLAEIERLRMETEGARAAKERLYRWAKRNAEHRKTEARRQALEEAAREVEDDDVHDVAAYVRAKLAAAIRALADKERSE